MCAWVCQSYLPLHTAQVTFVDKVVAQRAALPRLVAARHVVQDAVPTERVSTARDLGGRGWRAQTDRTPWWFCCRDHNLPDGFPRHRSIGIAEHPAVVPRPVMHE